MKRSYDKATFIKLATEILKTAEELASDPNANKGIIIPLELANGMWTKVHIEKPYWLREASFVDKHGKTRFKAEKSYYASEVHGTFEFGLKQEKSQTSTDGQGEGSGQ